MKITLASSLLLLTALPVFGQASSSSSIPIQEGGGAKPQVTEKQNTSNAVIGHHGVEAAGSAITLETSEALFTVAAGLNACGYNTDLEHSLPVRTEIRNEIDAISSQSEGAHKARTALCDYIVSHQLGGALNLAQYVSLALFTTQPPELTPSVDETELPPDSTQVVNVLPLLRTFAEQAELHRLWIKHRPEYEAAVAQVHDPLTNTFLQTNIYLHQPASSYDGRRFVVLLEPLLAPSATNARLYGVDYFVVTSPSPLAPNANPKVDAGVNLNEIRHSYLHYEVEPILYARAAATERLLPLLRSVADSPLDPAYKNDILALVAECLIKAIEARTMDVGFPKPARPVNVRARSEIDLYNNEIISYERRAESVRRAQVTKDMNQGWIITEYLYTKLTQMEASNLSLKEDLGEMVYGMDVQHQVNRAKSIPFDAVSERDALMRPRAARPKATPLEIAEKKLFQGDYDGAQAIADSELSRDPSSTRALYVAARINIIHGKPQEAVDQLDKIVSIDANPADPKDPETLAWAHIYLGRLYDTREDSRDDAVREYKAALTVNKARANTRLAAESGIKKPFSPNRPEPDAPKQDTSMPPLLPKQ